MNTHDSSSHFLLISSSRFSDNEDIFNLISIILKDTNGFFILDYSKKAEIIENDREYLFKVIKYNRYLLFKFHKWSDKKALEIVALSMSSKERQRVYFKLKEEFIFDNIRKSLYSN